MQTESSRANSRVNRNRSQTIRQPCRCPSSGKTLLVVYVRVTPEGEHDCVWQETGLSIQKNIYASYIHFTLLNMDDWTTQAIIDV